MLRLLIILGIAGLAGAVLALRKGRSPAVWFVLCAAAPLAVIVIAALPALPAAGYSRECPYCAELIKEEAKLCKHCGRRQPVDMLRVNDMK